MTTETRQDGLRAIPPAVGHAPGPKTAQNGSGRNGQYRAPGKTRGKRPRGSDPRSKDPERQIERFLIPMLNAYARRALAEDPGIGLAGLVRLEALIKRLTREVGEELVASYGATRVGEGLDWSRERAKGRWTRKHPQCPVPGLPRELMPL